MKESHLHWLRPWRRRKMTLFLNSSRKWDVSVDIEDNKFGPAQHKTVKLRRVIDGRMSPRCMASSRNMLS